MGGGGDTFLGDRNGRDYDAVYDISNEGDSNPRQVFCDGDLDGDGLDDLVILNPSGMRAVGAP